MLARLTHLKFKNSKKLRRFQLDSIQKTECSGGISTHSSPPKKKGLQIKTEYKKRTTQFKSAVNWVVKILNRTSSLSSQKKPRRKIP